ncbi:MAG: hydroxyisourate hydrolase [Candidatus Marinimicrobia bacterium]|nr:hydroxyisourate hydrolase [Candidatus Neomarinimicrobiota bacterium]
MNSTITTHVLDTSNGRPAEGIHATLDVLEGTDSWKTLGEGTTNKEGRIDSLLRENNAPMPGTYRLTFDVAPYFQSLGIESFFEKIPIVFRIKDPDQHYHVPLLLNPFGYSTYRGS